MAAFAAIAIIGVTAVGYAVVRSRAKPRTTVAVDAGPLTAEGYLLGRPDAPVKIIEFADFECPACGQFATVTEPDVRKRLIETGQASLRFYDFPLEMHKNTWAASHAAACAAEQGKFWEMHDRLFMGQLEWNGEAERNPKGVLEGYAKELGLDAARWEECYDSRRNQKLIEAHQAEGQRRKVQSTPTFIVGTRMVAGSLSYDALKALVDSVAAEAPPASVPTRPDSAATR